ncbi:hypothetical protein KCU99_g106, partial [Aureobasidium melanogenum]
LNYFVLVRYRKLRLIDTQIPFDAQQQMLALRLMYPPLVILMHACNIVASTNALSVDQDVRDCASACGLQKSRLQLRAQRVKVELFNVRGRHDVVLFKQDSLCLLRVGAVALGEDDDYVLGLFFKMEFNSTSTLCSSSVSSGSAASLLSLDHLPAGNALLAGIDNSVDGIFGTLLYGIGNLLRFLGSLLDVDSEWLLVLSNLLAGNGSKIGIADVGGFLLFLSGLLFLGNDLVVLQVQSFLVLYVQGICCGKDLDPALRRHGQVLELVSVRCCTRLMGNKKHSMTRVVMMLLLLDPTYMPSRTMSSVSSSRGKPWVWSVGDPLPPPL